jgi:hypothetical protein
MKRSGPVAMLLAINRHADGSADTGLMHNAASPTRQLRHASPTHAQRPVIQRPQTSQRP